ncbi:hypothetical protein BLA23254_06583 [Burkholderia lata]|uniref:Uncharacterized protein n=1 Tax=Burkholderia lata (strain ATCC 17760 / DSM 23089 / LMG 22485 / NCIMB 9086 / R18194 / 383) TaxID=482957 RepID=A0A6P2RGC6_BURL3|nr:hypothetical protein BLA23254_06583 [Burkholderia lata]
MHESLPEPPRESWTRFALSRCRHVSGISELSVAVCLSLSWRPDRFVCLQTLGTLSTCALDCRTRLISGCRIASRAPRSALLAPDPTRQHIGTVQQSIGPIDSTAAPSTAGRYAARVPDALRAPGRPSKTSLPSCSRLGAPAKPHLHEVRCGSGRRPPSRGKATIDTTVGLEGLRGQKILDAMCHIRRYRTTNVTPVEPSFINRFVVALAWEKPFDHPVD